MKLIFLIGNSAVGKMTVGQELTKITDLRLFHNHMSIEPMVEVLGYFDRNAIERLRKVFFEEFAKSDNYGMIFTFMWAFDREEDAEYVEYVKNIFTKYNDNMEFYCVEIVASQKIRMERNVTENRLNNKATKRNIEESNKRVIDYDNNHRLESFDGEVPFENYIRIDNSFISPDKVASTIKEKFDL